MLLKLLRREVGGEVLLLIVCGVLLGSRLLLLVPHGDADTRVVYGMVVGGGDSQWGSVSPLVTGSLWQLRLLLVLPLTDVDGGLIVVAVAPLVSPVLVSELPLVSTVSVSSVDLSSSFSPFSCLVIWLQDIVSDCCVLVLLASSFSMLEDSAAILVDDSSSCHTLVLSLLSGISGEGKSSWSLSGWEDVRNGGSQSRISLKEPFQFNDCLSLVEECVEVYYDSACFVSLSPVNSPVSHVYTVDGSI